MVGNSGNLTQGNSDKLTESTEPCLWALGLSLSGRYREPLSFYLPSALSLPNTEYQWQPPVCIIAFLLVSLRAL